MFAEPTPELKDGSRNIGLVVHNGMSRPISMNGGRIIGRVVTANVVPNASLSPELLQELNKDEEEPTKKLTVQEKTRIVNASVTKERWPGYARKMGKTIC